VATLHASCRIRDLYGYLSRPAGVSRNDGRLNAECRLVTYGTVGRCKPNHHQLDGLDGRWLKGHVGMLVDAGWARAWATQHWSFRPTVRQSLSRFSSQPTCQITGHASTTSRRRISTRCDRSAHTDWRDGRVHLRPSAGPKLGLSPWAHDRPSCRALPRSSGQSISRGACSTRYCQEPSGWCRVGDHEGESS
jgi:hypothetical protein